MTLNEIISSILTYGNNHAQIKYTWFGGFAEKLDDNDVIYPAMFVDLEGSSFLPKLLTHTVSIYIMDRHIAETEALEVLSDTSLICEDIIAQLRNNSNIYTVADNITMQPFMEAEPDYLAGWRLDVALTVPSINNRCQIP